MAEDERAAIVHRELIQLVGLIIAAIAAFMFTRAVAASNRELTRRDAAEWFARGQQAERNARPDEAVDAYRRASAKDPSMAHELALSRALVRTGQTESARNVLLTLRDAEPDNPTINLELARLAAGRDDVDEALRFYHNALYAPWPATTGESPQPRIRLDLAKFLLAHNRPSVALSEMLVASAELPDTPAAHVELAQLFARAGDTRHALEQDERALQLDPHNAEALAGAGEAAFARGDYATARDRFQRAQQDVPRVRPELEIARLVLSSDPLAARLGASERVRRLTADLAYLRGRVEPCPESLTDLSEIDAFSAQLQTPAGRDADAIEEGVDLLERIVTGAINRCPPATAQDRALLLIGSRHEASAR